MSWCLVNKVTMDLTSVASLSVSDGVRDHFWPIISKFLESISKFWTKFVSSTHTVMSFFECFPVPLYVTSSGGGFHHAIGDTVFL